jgi:hypothetical protein
MRLSYVLASDLTAKPELASVAIPSVETKYGGCAESVWDEMLWDRWEGTSRD